VLRYTFSELGQGLRRNLSMHIAVILTLFVSLTMVGLGLFASAEAAKASEYWGTKLQITVWLCNQDDDQANCSGEANDEQRAVILQAIDDNPEVDAVDERTKQDAFDSMREFVGPEEFERTSEIVPVEAMRNSIWITLKDPERFEGVTSAVRGLDGVYQLQDVREYLDKILSAFSKMRTGALFAAGLLIVAALLLVGNTIRLAALARRREIAIMRLVGASSLYITLPFLLEALVTALFSVLLAAGALALVMRVGIMQGLSELQFIPWIGWSEYLDSVLFIAVLGPVLTLIPTLLLTRRYLKV
jgi:cell division transport system permease protein